MIRRRALTLASLRHRPDSYRNTNTTIPRLSSLSAPNPNRKRLFSSSSKLSQTQSRIDIRCLVSHHYLPLISISINGVKNGNLGVRSMATRTMNDSSNRPPKETILLDGCDFEHWLVVLKAPDPNLTRDEIIDSYIKTLAQVLGSEEEARMKIYSVSTRHYFAFGCIVSEELSYKIKEVPNVSWVLPDSYFDVKNKDYGGEPFINGQAVPYDPRYHEVWVRNHNDSLKRNSNNKNRPRREDRTRNIQRRDDMMSQNMRPPPPLPPSQPNPPSASNNNFTPTPNYQNQRDNMMSQNMRPPPPLPPSQPNPPSASNNNFTPTPNYQNQRDNMMSQNMRPPPPPNPPSASNNNFTPTPNYQNQGPPPMPNFSSSNIPARNMRSPLPPPSTPNPAPGLPNQNFTPTPIYQSQDPPPSRDMPLQMQNPDVQRTGIPPQAPNSNFQNRDVRPSMQSRDYQNSYAQSIQNPDVQRTGIPPQAPNSNFQNRDMRPSMQSGDYQNSYAQSIQNRDFQSRETPPPMANGEVPNRHMPPPTHNWNNEMRPPSNNFNFQDRDVVSQPKQNNEYLNRDIPPPMHNQRYPNRDVLPSQQNQNFYNRSVPHPIENHDLRNRGMSHPVQHQGIPYKNTGNIQPGDYPSWGSDMGVMPNEEYQNKGMPRYTSMRNEQNERNHGGHMNTGNVQGIDLQGWGSSSNATNMGNSPNRDYNYRSGDISNGEFEAVANKNF